MKKEKYKYYRYKDEEFDNVFRVRKDGSWDYFASSWHLGSHRSFDTMLTSYLHSEGPLQLIEITEKEAFVKCL